jgi:hypothetical protein
MIWKLLPLILLFSCTGRETPKEKLRNYLKKYNTYKTVLSYEGDFVHVFNPVLIPFIENELDNKRLTELWDLLSGATSITLTPQGFVKAAEREVEGNDETNYDAVWVRDSAWVALGLLKVGEVDKASKLIRALWSYYAKDHQIDRFLKCIENPNLALNDKMAVPHIRFDGTHPDYIDMQRDGKPEVWNHRQNDAHGLFLLALYELNKKEKIKWNELPSKQKQVIALFPKFFDAINYTRFAGAGAWEEIDKVNTSSVAIVTKAMERWLLDLPSELNWDKRVLQKLINKGYGLIRSQLRLGGESPSTGTRTPNFRREDAALFNLFLPYPLKDLTFEEKRYALTIIEKLVRPFGVIRYQKDSYQSGNFWIREKNEITQENTATGDASSNDEFLKRYQNFIAGTEAQWFFDSKLSLIYSELAKERIHPTQQKIYKHYAHLYFKRALGQVTGKFNAPYILAADGKKVGDMQVTESINIVIIKGKRYYLPSPITPLNWAKISLKMAMFELL